ncbi:MAG: hypothetical protein U1F53_03210 [Burkholderiaceae bacterium]
MGDDEIVPQQELGQLRVAGLRRDHAARPQQPQQRGLHPGRAAARRAGGEPRIYSTGTILYEARTDAAVINNLDDALTHLKRQKAEGAISVKSYQQPRRSSASDCWRPAAQTGMMARAERLDVPAQRPGMIVDGARHRRAAHRRSTTTSSSSGRRPGWRLRPLNVAYGGLDGEHYWYARTSVWGTRC